MIHIQDIETKGFDCREACHILLSNFYRKEYEAIFYNIFNFSFDKKAFGQTRELGSCLRWPISIPDNASHIYNLSLQGEFVQKSEVLEAIPPLLKRGIPVVIETSTYYCPWLKQYKIIDNPRYLLALDSGGSWLDVIDTTLKNQRVKRLYYQDFPPERLGVGTAVISPYSQDSEKSFHMMITHLKSLNLQKCFEDCSEVLQELNSLDNEFNAKGYYGWSMNADIFFGQRLPNSSRYFVDFLKYTEKNFLKRKMFTVEYPVLEQISLSWIIFRNLFFKSKVTSSFNQAAKDKLCLLLGEICRLYQYVVDSVLKKA